MWVKTVLGSHLGVGAPPVLEPSLLHAIGMFTHSPIFRSSPLNEHGVAFPIFWDTSCPRVFLPVGHPAFPGAVDQTCAAQGARLEAAGAALGWEEALRISTSFVHVPADRAAHGRPGGSFEAISSMGLGDLVWILEPE